MAPAPALAAQLTGLGHTLEFETEDEAKAALAEVNEALGLHPRQQQQGRTVAGLLVVKPRDIRSAEIRESPPPVV